MGHYGRQRQEANNIVHIVISNPFNLGGISVRVCACVRAGERACVRLCAHSYNRSCVLSSVAN